MTTEIVVAFIALFGVIASVIVSYLTSQRQIRTELDRFQMQIEQIYATKLFEQRFEAYPLLYEIVSDFVKKTRYGVITKSEFDDFVTKVQAWDSKNSIFASAITVKSLFRLIRLAHEIQDAGEDLLTKESLMEKLICKIADLELAIKTELGVFARKGYHSPTEIRTVDDVLTTLRGPHHVDKDSSR